MAQINDTDGVRVVMSSAQLAAVLSRQSISQTETVSNRLWGGLQVVGGNAPSLDGAGYGRRGSAGHHQAGRDAEGAAGDGEPYRLVGGSWRVVWRRGDGEGGACFQRHDGPY